jgi:branched-chain amino acid transport system permease protein
MPKDGVAVPTEAVAQTGVWARPTVRHLIIAAVIVVALVIPFVAHSFVVFELTQVMIYGLAILGLNLLTGFNGQFSLGHSAFYGIGAYTAAILIHNYEVSYLWTLPAAGGVCFAVGFLFGLPALRLQNLYLALATFALAVAMPQILKFHALEAWTGGVQGLVVDQPEAPSFLPIDDDQWLYYFTLIVILVMFGAAANLVKSRTGRAIMAIRDNPIAAAAMGINLSLYKTLTFGVSAFYTGVAGELQFSAVRLVPGGPRDWRRRFDCRLLIRWALRALCAQHRQQHFYRLGGGDLRRHSVDRDFRHAGRRHRLCAACRHPPFPSATASFG